MLQGDSTSVLQTPTPASGSRGGGGGGGEAAPPLSTSSSHLESARHVNDQERGGGGVDEGDRSFGGNRWPREETLALLRVRSDMDVAFRDASVKGPLWDEVSRKLAELGYNRSAKKCKEKFENVYKYHKRTKDGRTGKHEGKTYRFFDQLEAFESHPPPSFPPPQKLIQPPPIPVANPPPPASHVISTTATSNAATVPSKNVLDQGINLTVTPQLNPSTNIPSMVVPSFSGDLVSNSTSSYSTSSDVEAEGGRGRKRKWKDFLEGLMKEVIRRQEEMQTRFLEAIEKREHDRMAREEAWRMQEMARINREREILAQERSMSSAKDAAVMAFLQKLSEQQNPGNPVQQQQVHHRQPTQQPQLPVLAQPVQATVIPPPPPPSPPPLTATLTPSLVVAPQPVQTPPQQQQQQQQSVSALTLPPARGQEVKPDNNGDQLMASGASSSRWPKVEVEALIHLRTTLDSKYQENGPKGPLWEEISGGMRKLGYSRNAKRCKEKWENINKYFKKVKESNKKRPEDSKTCPYFNQLDALYREKNANTSVQFKPENSVPLMVRPEQQWPPPPAPPPPPPSDSAMGDLESDDDKDNEDDDEEDEAGAYEIVPNRQTSISSAG